MWASQSGGIPGAVPFSWLGRSPALTASAWMNVSWSDGPTDREVSAVTGKYEGREFNGMTDSYDDQGSALVAL